MTATVAQSTRPIIADGAELTWEDYLKTPEVRFRYEILEGIVKIMSPAAVSYHTIVAGEIYTPMKAHVKQHRLGIVFMAPTDVVIRRTPKLNTRQPDVFFVRMARLGIQTQRDMRSMPQIEIAPDIAVEVLSPDEVRYGIADKLADYAEIGVPELWAVNLDAETVEVLVLQNGQYVRAGLYGTGDTIASTVLPGLRLTVDAVFA